MVYTGVDMCEVCADFFYVGLGTRNLNTSANSAFIINEPLDSRRDQGTLRTECRENLGRLGRAVIGIFAHPLMRIFINLCFGGRLRMRLSPMRPRLSFFGTYQLPSTPCADFFIASFPTGTSRRHPPVSSLFFSTNQTGALISLTRSDPPLFFAPPRYFGDGGAI